MNCPGCKTSDLHPEVYPTNYGKPVEIDVCHACNGIWFDGRESLSLSPGSTLQLFKSMHERQAAARAPLIDRKACPRCQAGLRSTTDMVRNTRFTYFRCEEHGRFITFFEWLREKSLVRTPNPKELEALKARVKFVNCSNCGAPVSIHETTNCGHCSAPVSILAGEAIEQTLKNLHTKEIDRNTYKPERLVEAMMVKQQMESKYRQEAMADAWRGSGGYGRSTGFAADLVGVGLGLLLEVIFS